MKHPLHVMLDVAKLQLKQAAKRGDSRYPLVLMLEPLYTCNLACIGCSTERHTGKLRDRLPVATCLKAVDDCGAPMVSICGGEPTLYPELPELVGRIIDRKRHVFICTNGLLLDETVFDVISPQPRLTLNIHLDGAERTHDFVCAKEGVFAKAMEMIRASKERGYRVMINTTIFKETDLEEIELMCDLVTAAGVDGILISPGYHYESIDREIFLTRREIEQKFRHVLTLSSRYPLTSTPMFLEFAAGLRDYPCSPWSTVTFTPNGWKGPCYLIGEKYSSDFEEFWRETDWNYWESRKDKRCQNCAMHSGFEASVIREISKHPADIPRLLRWTVTH